MTYLSFLYLLTGPQGPERVVPEAEVMTLWDAKRAAACES